jgi:hypothetical protein
MIFAGFPYIFAGFPHVFAAFPPWFSPSQGLVGGGMISLGLNWEFSFPPAPPMSFMRYLLAGHRHFPVFRIANKYGMTWHDQDGCVFFLVNRSSK